MTVGRRTLRGPTAALLASLLAAGPLALAGSNSDQYTYVMGPYEGLTPLEGCMLEMLDPCPVLISKVHVPVEAPEVRIQIDDAVWGHHPMANGNKAAAFEVCAIRHPDIPSCSLSGTLLLHRLCRKADVTVTIPEGYDELIVRMFEYAVGPGLPWCGATAGTVTLTWS